MIPKNSTPIKNDILIDIFATGLLSKDEMRIIFYIIRWSWGFDGKHRRQDFTKELTKRQIAIDIGMAEQHIGKNINKMIKKNIIIIKDGCYQFNEHFEKWGKLTKSVSFNNDKKLTKKVSKTNQIGYQNSPNLLVKLTKKVSSADSKPLQNKPLPDRKETKRNFKETLKKRGNIFKKTWKDFKEMRKKNRRPMTLRAEELIMRELDKLATDEKTQIAILNQSIINSWQGVFPLKDNQSNYIEDSTDKIKKKKIVKLTDEQIKINKEKISSLVKGFKNKFNIEGNR